MDGFDIDRGVSASLLVLAACIACQVPDVRSDAGSEPERDGGLRIVADCEDGWCRIPPGTFVMGSPEDEWGHPARSENQVQVTFTRGFLIQQHELTQREWTALGLPNPSGRNPDGTGACSEPECPVGNVTWFEAVAFANLLSDAEGLPRCYELEDCTPGMGEGMACGHIALTTETLYDCVGYRLPTEAEWELAARGGLDGAVYCWGDELMPQGRHLANTWQGEFPWQNLRQDGFEGTAPVRSFPPNGYGLYEMTGNVWEWTRNWYRDRHKKPNERKACCVPTDPRGPSVEHSYDACLPRIRIPRRVIKGGSFLCAPNYCRRYRPAARYPQMIDTATCHVGFRCVVRASSDAT